MAMRDYMLDYVISLLEDANDFSWGRQRPAMPFYLCRMELGEISGFFTGR